MKTTGDIGPYEDSKAQESTFKNLKVKKPKGKKRRLIDLRPVHKNLLTKTFNEKHRGRFTVAVNSSAGLYFGASANNAGGDT